MRYQNYDRLFTKAIYLRNLTSNIRRKHRVLKVCDLEVSYAEPIPTWKKNQLRASKKNDALFATLATKQDSKFYKPFKF